MVYFGILRDPVRYRSISWDTKKYRGISSNVGSTNPTPRPELLRGIKVPAGLKSDLHRS